jgi:xanthosine utilization system XapX-like protein
MGIDVIALLGAVTIGLGATVTMDVWALLINRAFGVPLPNYCLVGRWFSHMPDGTFVHASIAAAAQKPNECTVGWIAHYVVGAGYGLVFVALVSGGWLGRPTLLPALVFGVVSVLVAYLILQPSFGLGIAASKTPQPMHARLRSLMAHTIFGIGLYLSAVGLSYALRAHA